MTASPPPGWYPAPQTNDQRRYWDGAQWAQPPAVVAATPSAPRRNTWKSTAIVALCLSAVLLFLWTSMLASIGGSSMSAPAPAAAADTSLEERAAVLKAREQEVAARETAVAAREEAASSWVTTVLNDGIYTIGKSAEPGIYRTETVGEYCQWNIYLTGTGIYDTEGTINFGVGEPGPVQVTVSEGQDFSSSDCGTWNRIG